MMALYNGEIGIGHPGDLDTVKPFTYLYYLGSEGCSCCRLKSLHQWESLFLELGLVDEVNLVVIVEPADSVGIEDLAACANESWFGYPIYVDTEGAFLESNPQFPKSPGLRSFLMDSDKNVVLVGDILENKNLRPLALKVIGSEDTPLETSDSRYVSYVVNSFSERITDSEYEVVSEMLSRAPDAICIYLPDNACEECCHEIGTMLRQLGLVRESVVFSFPGNQSVSAIGTDNRKEYITSDLSQDILIARLSRGDRPSMMKMKPGYSDVLHLFLKGR